ncbi:MAG: hypothetical protein NT069_27350, partial [Planctomycetota bacterium]|nr:hypothetical protein [Planctomycetota bacterium]
MSEDRRHDAEDNDAVFVEKIAAWRAGIDRQEIEEWLLEMVLPKIRVLSLSKKLIDPALTPADLRSEMSVTLLEIIPKFQGTSRGEFINFAGLSFLNKTRDVIASQPRDAKADRIDDSLSESNHPRDPNRSPPTLAFTREVFEQVVAFIESLPDPLDREVASLALRQGMRPVEIADK